MAKRLLLLKLKPTQLALGMLEIQDRVKKYADFNRKKMRRLVKKCKISVVVAPNGFHYIVDGHHHACVFWQLGVKRVSLHVVKDFSKSHMSYREFWKKMKSNNWTHLYDQFGRGPHDPIYLPGDIRGLGDDPYRSLAWLIEVKNGFKKTTIPYANFQWANFFRGKKLLHSKFETDFSEVENQALDLAFSSSAHHLPGFAGKKDKRT